MSQLNRKPYSEQQIELLKTSITNQLQKGMLVEYEITVGDLMAVARTSKIEDFDSFHDFIESDTRCLRVVVYNKSYGAEPRIEYQYSMRDYVAGRYGGRLSPEDQEVLIEKRVEQALQKRDLEDTKRLLELSQARVSELETELKGLRQPETLSGIDVDAKVNEKMAAWEAKRAQEQLEKDYKDAKEQITQLEEELEEANLRAEGKMTSIVETGGQILGAALTGLPMYKRVENHVMGMIGQPVNGPTDESETEVSFREKQPESPAGEGFKRAFYAAMQRFDTQRMVKFNTIFQACLEDPSLVDQFEDLIPKQH